MRKGGRRDWARKEDYRRRQPHKSRRRSRRSPSFYEDAEKEMAFLFPFSSTRVRFGRVNVRSRSLCKSWIKELQVNCNSLSYLIVIPTSIYDIHTWNKISSWPEHKLSQNSRRYSKLASLAQWGHLPKNAAFVSNIALSEKSRGQNENAVREGGADNALEWCGIWKYARGIQELRKRVCKDEEVSVFPRKKVIYWKMT